MPKQDNQGMQDYIKEKADEIERLREVNAAQMKYIEAERVIRERLDDEIERLDDEIERLREALQNIVTTGHEHSQLLTASIAEAALQQKESEK